MPPYRTIPSNEEPDCQDFSGHRSSVEVSCFRPAR